MKQQEHITSEIPDTQNLPDDVIEAVLHCLTHKFDCPIPQCSCRHVKLKINEIKVIQIVESGSGIDHGENKIMTTVEQFEAKSDVLPSICVDDIPLSDNIDKSYEADDNDVKRVRHHQHLGMLPVYDSGLSFDSVGSNDAEDF